MTYKSTKNTKDALLTPLVNQYNKSSHQDGNKLNIFTLISDTYHKEDFHSDILNELIIYDSNILYGLIDLINAVNPRVNLKKDDYKSYKSVREEGRIDILVTDSISKKAIIIENKINNAVDQPKQLLRYYKKIKQDYKVDAIVYLSLDGIKHPSTHGWDDDKKIEILDILIKLAAHNNGSNDIYSLLKKNENNKDSYLSCLSKQYSELITTLSNKHIMDNKVMTAFYDKLLDKDTCDYVRDLIKMYDDIPSHYALKTQQKFDGKQAPFESIQIHNRTTAFFDKLKIDSSDFAIDVIHKKDTIVVEIFDRNYKIEEQGENPAQLLLQKISSTLLGFNKIDNSFRLRKSFNFPEEDADIYPFISDLLSKLSNLT